jgi:hypothetical protein
MGESQYPGPGSGVQDEQPGSYFLELRNHFFAFFGVTILKFFDEDPGSGMETVRIRDPGWKKVGSEIRDKHPGSATLTKMIRILDPQHCESGSRSRFYVTKNGKILHW